MKYKKTVPKFVFDRWKKLNPNYNIDFSLDDQCITFIRENFNDYIADLWRLCKLYIDGGVYADVDLVPYINISCLSAFSKRG
jgi:mannosyltransferase OCH1-like enzyme